MLNNAILAATLMLSVTLTAQDMPKNESGRYEYSEVISVAGATKEQLFRSSRSWFQDKFNQKTMGNNVIYTDDSFLGEMAASPMVFVEIHASGKNRGAGSVTYNINVSSKEGKYKITVGEFYHESNRSMYCSGGALEADSADCEGNNMTLEAWKEIKQNTKMNIEKLLEDLKAYMAKAATNGDGNW